MSERKVTCGHCDRPAELVTGKVIYPRRVAFFDKWYWRCEPCGAYVGCHPGGTQPMGRLANEELRKARQRVHKALDPLWKSGSMTRSEAYKMLAVRLSIAKQNCHVGMFDLATCARAEKALAISERTTPPKEKS